MPDLAVTNTFSNGTTADATQVNTNFDDVETWANASIASVLADSSSAGRLIVCNGSGVPVYVTGSGDVTNDSSGVFTIGNNKVSEEKVTAAVRDALGLTGGAVTRRDYAEVLTEQTTTSATWADLATVGPSVTVTTPSGGLLLVGASVEMKGTSGGADARVGVHVGTDWEIAGAPETGEALLAPDDDAYTSLPHTAFKLIPVTAGSRTVTLKYASDIGASTSTYKNRKLWVVAMGGF